MSTLTNTVSNSPLNSNVGFNNSWIEVENGNRELYAQAIYAVNNTLTNIVSNSPLNSNIGYNNSWIEVSGDDLGERPFYAQAVYITNLEDIGSGSGSGSGYVLPVASVSTLGGVKVDGTTIVINDGIISSTISSTSPSLTSGFVGLNEPLILNNLTVQVIDVSDPRTGPGGPTKGYWIQIKPTDDNSTQYFWSIIGTPYIEGVGSNATFSVIGSTTTPTWFTIGGSGDVYTPNPTVGGFIEQQGAVLICTITDKTNLKTYKVIWQVLGYGSEETPVFPLYIEKMIG